MAINVKMRRKKIFISRALSDDSPILEFRKNYDVIDQSLLKFTPLKFDHVPETDWIFFYSQQGVKHFLDAISALPQGPKIATFGQKTAQSMIKKGIDVSFTGNGVAEDTAKAFCLVARGSSVLFIRAKHSRQALQKGTEKEIEVHELVVYNNTPADDIDVPHCDVLIFTSPLNAKTYYGKYSIDSSQKIIAMGHTTADTLLNLGLNNVDIPNQSSENALADLVKDILNSDAEI